MLRTLFFVLSLLADYRAFLEVLQVGAVWALVNTGAFLSVMTYVYIRRMRPRRAERTENLDPLEVSC